MKRLALFTIGAVVGGLGALVGLLGCVGAEVGVGAGVAVEDGPVYYGPEYGPEPWIDGGTWINGRRYDRYHHEIPAHPAPAPREYHAPPLHADREHEHPLPHLPDRPRPAVHPAPGPRPGGEAHARPPVSAPPRGGPPAPAGPSGPARR